MAFKEYTGKVIPADGGYTEYAGEVVPMEGAGAGRGRVNPPAGGPPLKLADARPAQAAQPAPEATTGDPMGMGGAEIMASGTPRKMSVLEGMQMPVPEFDAAEAERLSNRAYAQRPAVRQLPPGSNHELRPSTPIENRSVLRAAGDTALGITQGALGLVKGAADNINAGDNPISRFYDKSIKAADRLKSDDLRDQQIKRDSEIAIAERNDGELGGARAAFSSMFRHPGAGLDVVARGAGSMVPTIAMGAAGAGTRIMGGVNALSNAGDAASQTADELRRLPQQAWARDEDYLTLLTQGATHEQAVAELAPRKAMAAQALGGLTGALSGSTGLEKALAGKAVGNAIRQRAGRVGTEALGEQAETLIPQMAGNSAVSGLDQETSVFKGLGRAAVETAAGSLPGSALAARRVSEPQIKRLREAGDTAAADVMQKGLDRQTAIESASAELEGMASAAPDQAFHANPAFQDNYRQLRAEGIKPAEASARAAMTSGFADMAPQIGLSPKAMEAAAAAVKDMPLEKVPGFLERFAAKLAGSGMGKPLPAGTVADAISAQGDSAMTATLDSVYRDEPPIADILEMEQNQAVAPELIAQEAINSDSESLLRPIDQAAHEAATSPLNDLPEPTDAQKEAGNYKVGRINLHGLAISVENPAGSDRSGTDAKGKRWSNTLQSHYGYIRGSTGNDGDHVDTFIGGNPDSQKVFVVDQVNKDGGFDEHKVLLGFDSQQEADAGYHANYHAGWTGRGAITEVPLDEFKAWVKDGIKTKPFGKISAPDKGPASADASPGVQPATDSPVAAPDSAEQRDGTLSVGRTGTAPQGGRSARSGAFDRNPLLAFVAKHGLFHDAGKSNSLKSEFSPDRQVMVPGYGPVFRKTGKNLDLLTQSAIEDGYLPQGGNATQLYDLIRRAVAGEKILPMHAEGVTETEGQRQLEARQAIANESDIGNNTEGTFDVGDENAAASSFSDLSDDALFELDDSISLEAQSNVSTESAMRSMGFSQQEIENATAQEQGRSQKDRPSRGKADEIAPAQAPPDTGQRDAQTRPPARPVSDKQNPQNPADAGFFNSGFKTELRPSGTLAVKGNATAITEALKEAGITKFTPMDGGIMVGKSQAQKALAALEGRPAEAPAPKVLSIGMTPATAEAVTVKDGVVYIGKNEAIDFDSGNPVTVASMATDAQIVKALKDAGSLSRNTKVFGLQDTTESKPSATDDKKPARNESLVELRKQLSVLKSIRKCMGAE